MAVFFAGRVQLKGLPIASHCAEQLKMSSSYFVDLLKHDTGKTFHEYVQFKRWDFLLPDISVCYLKE